MVRTFNQDGGSEFKETKQHTHVGDGRIVGRANAMETLKRKTTDSLDSGRHVVAKLNENIDVATAATFPTTKSMVQTVRRVRAIKELPSNPKSLIDLVIPDSFMSVNSRIFLLHDSGRGPNRMLLFATDDNLNLLSRANVLAMDGTFNIAPPMF